MKQNVGPTDVIVRMSVGSLLVVMSLMGVIGWWGLIGVVPFATGVLKYCPLYGLLNINTCEKQDPPPN